MEMMYLMMGVMNANSHVSWNASYATWGGANFVLQGFWYLQPKIARNLKNVKPTGVTIWIDLITNANPCVEIK